MCAFYVIVQRMIDLKAIRTIRKENATVAENYVFMTVLQALNMCFYLLVYPFLIRVLGVDSYGLYVYAAAVVALLQSIKEVIEEIRKTKKGF